MAVGLNEWLFVAGLLFATGFFGVLLRRNILVMLMSLELMLNAVNLGLVGVARYHNSLEGALFVFFTITVAAAEVAVGLAIVVALYRRKQSVMIEDFNLLKN